MDDIPRDVKLRRVGDVFKVYRRIAEELNKEQIGQYQLILVEGVSLCIVIQKNEIEYTFSKINRLINVYFVIVYFNLE